MEKLERSSTTEGIPVSPTLGPSLEAAKVSTRSTPIDPRAVYLCAVSLFIGAAAGGAAWLLLKLIAFFTHLAFFGKISFALDFDARGNHLGPFIIFIPVIGGIIVGLLARYGSRAVAGHGIPEAMEQVLTNQSRIPPRMTFLKPFSAAVSIGTGGPFGPEGPIIATGGAIGSLFGQLMDTTAAERKILLSAGAAAGIAAAFGTPIAAVLLAIELLLFEFRPRSILCVALASAVAAMIHSHFDGPGAMFPFSGAAVPAPTDRSLLIYSAMGVLVGLAAIVMTRTVYLVEAVFERLPIHWMWCPAIGAVVVGVIGYFNAGILGPGYFNLTDLLGHQQFALQAAILLCGLKFIAWTVSLGSGTTGGTLAPVFTIGGAFAMALAVLTQRLFPHCGIDVRVAALMGMVAIFAGASRALLTCIIFAVEVTHAPNCILPALCGCSFAYLISSLLMRYSIMTEKMVRQGIRVPVEYGADFLDTVTVEEVMTPNPVVLQASQAISEARKWLESGASGSDHQGFPVVDETGIIAGIVTHRDLVKASDPAAPIKSMFRRPPVVIYADCSIRDAADHMVNHGIGRLPVIARGKVGRVIGIVTRSDLISAHSRRLDESRRRRAISLWHRNGSNKTAGS